MFPLSLKSLEFGWAGLQDAYNNFSVHDHKVDEGRGETIWGMNMVVTLIVGLEFDNIRQRLTVSQSLLLVVKLYLYVPA